ncbi:MULTISPECIES: hypothetical protein [unclassified Streptococcus]|uniref:hypothetical protein n=1 Tax=unclassified Streptococcus TaxID=2608887 RepID=UPI0010717DB0|nr:MULTISPECIES: hypothetical protein [unclassified Streptococcus]MBF0805920.1 hypothetical protein [Streptococcus sp. 19428wA2_WM07]TFU28538.1 hypothetical protein E4T71_03780 [Streptococcus sp. WM07]
MKGFLKFLSVLAVLLGITWYLLLPSKPVTDQERFGTWEDKTNFVTLIQQAISNLTSTGDGLTSQMVVSNNTLKSILNENLSEEQKSDLADSAISFEQSNLQVRQPLVLFDPLTSQLELNMTLVTKEGQLEAVIESAKLGKIPLPKFLLRMVLDKDAISPDFRRDDLTLPITLPAEGYALENIEIHNGQAIVYLKLDRERLLAMLESQMKP